jgi:hypothetical protein
LEKRKSWVSVVGYMVEFKTRFKKIALLSKIMNFDHLSAFETAIFARLKH